ncbi:AAA family ATPase [Halomonas halocynthiae]|uniref:AAA family ATPase n=1 Tax=Halomonas halocynthiae TaxID=176290 RepID=UPI000485F818
MGDNAKGVLDQSKGCLTLLGSFSLSLGGNKLTQFSYDKVKALLVYLLLHDQPVSRLTLAELLWPNQGAAGRANLRHALHSLRQSLGEHADQLLWASRHSIGFVRRDDWLFDLHDLQKLLEEPPSPEACEAVLDCYRGDLVEELQLTECNDYQCWLVQVRNEWRHRVIRFTEQVLDAKGSQPLDDHMMMSLVNRFSSYGPFRERLVRQLVDSGQLAAAHEQHSRYLQLLALTGQQPTSSFLQLAHHWSQRSPESSQTHSTSIRRTLAVGSAPLKEEEIEQRQLSVMAIRLSLKADLSTRVSARAVLSLQTGLMHWLELQCQHLGGFWLAGATGGVGLACFGTNGPAHQLAELVALYEHCRMHLTDECLRHWDQESAPPRITFAAGLNSGQVLYLPERNIVDPLGQVMQESLALMDAAEGCELVISRQASEHMPPALDLQPRLSSRQVSHDGRIRLQALVLISASGSGEMAKPNLVGREVALRTLRDAHARASIGLLQSVLVSGPSGIGKSALLVGLRQLEQGQQTAICWQPATRLSSLEPYAMVRKMLRWHLAGSIVASAVMELMGWRGVEADEPPAANNNTASHRLLYDALGLRDTDESFAISQNSEALALVVELLHRLVLRITATRTLVLMIDDLQWLDEPSLNVLAELQARLAINSPFLLVASHHGRDALPGRINWDQQITLQRLDDKQSLRLLNHLISHYQLKLTPLLKQQITERCDGVPLYHQEICRRIALEQREGRPVNLDDLPKGLLGLLGSRIDQLGGDRHVAQVAAVLGRRFRLDFLAECSGVNGAELENALAHMERLEIIEPVSQGHEIREYQFTHQLLQEAAYLSCPKDIRAALHTQFIALIEQRFPVWISRRSGEFASHLRRSGQYVRAARYFELTAREAMNVSANRTALRMADAGLASLRDADGQSEREISLHNVRGQAAFALEGHGSPTAHESFTHARNLLKRERGDTSMDVGYYEQVFLVKWGLWVGCSQRHAHGEAFQLAERLAEIAGKLSDVRYGRLADFARASCDYWSGRIATAGQRLDALDPLNSPMMINSLSYSEHPQVTAACYQAWAMCLRGDYRRASVQIEAAIRLAERINHPGSLAMALLYAAAQYRQLGHVQLAAQRVERAYHLADSPDLQLWQIAARTMLGWQSALSGDPAGLERMDSAQQELAETTGRDPYEYPILALVDALLALEELPRAEGYLDRCLGIARQCLPLFVPELATQLARVRKQRGSCAVEVSRLIQLALEQACDDGNVHQQLCALEAWLTLVDPGDIEMRSDFRRLLGEVSYSDAPILIRWRALLDQIEPTNSGG